MFPDIINKNTPSVTMGCGMTRLLCAGVFLVSVDDEFAKQKFQNEVGDHGQAQNDVLIDTGTFGQRAEPGRQGREDQIESKDLGHGNGNIGGGLESIPAV